MCVKITILVSLRGLYALWFLCVKRVLYVLVKRYVWLRKVILYAIFRESFRMRKFKILSCGKTVTKNRVFFYFANAYLWVNLFKGKIVQSSNGLFYAGFSNSAGARRKSPATSSICAGYFSYFKFY